MARVCSRRLNATPPPRRGGPLAALVAAARFVSRCSERIGAVAAFATVPMILCAVAMSATSLLDRQFHTSLSSNALLEAQWYLFAFVFMLGAPATLARNGHVRVDAWYGRRSERTRHAIDLAGGLLFLLPFCAFGVFESLDFVQRSWELREGSPDPGGLPRYPVKALVPLGFGLLFVQGLAQVVLHGAALLARPAAEEPR